ncbi:zinc finger protein 431-like isoform X5 [Achroia grisella]|uniref:zinc finger protein 431-like isoform X5 n=1 Tax=Achroia grisella TaxID=688607 RepID=UPI0027D25BDD|nr:zinc finger protein 431-like isoform X5 [Achroia grisella]
MVKMSEDSWKLEKDLCRCCHSEGAFKNLSETCPDDGLEVYSDMLQFALNINMSPVAGVLCFVTYTICEQCIDRLRDAVNFKRQVQQCEDRFRDMYDRDIIKVGDSNVKLKQESPELDAEVADKNTDFPHMDTDDSDDFPLNYEADNRSETDVKKEVISKSKSKKTKPKQTKSKKKTEQTKKNESGDAGKKGGKTPTKSLFRLQQDDYTQDGEQFSCSRCDKRYYKFCSLRFHVKSKHYKIPRYSCPYCAEKFMTLAPLTVHKLLEHNVDERFKCNACKGTFNTKIQLRKHINNFHMLGEKYKCEFCEYESFSFEGEKPGGYYTLRGDSFVCKLCDRSYASQPLVSQHYRFVHLKRRPKVRKCPNCDQKVPGYLRAYHLEEAHNIPAPKCGICNKKFRFPHQVLQHQKKVHMGEKTVICKICDKGFFNNLSLRLHMAIHNEARQFKCIVCGREFRWENNLKDHLKIHTGDKKFVCKVCDKAFVQKSTLKQHGVRNHPGVDVT